MMSVTPVTMRLGHCCSALLMPPHKISTAWKPSTFAQSSPPRPRLLTIQSLKTKDGFKQCLWSSIKWGMWYRQYWLLLGPITAPHLQKGYTEEKGGQSAAESTAICTILLLDTGSPLLYSYNTFLPHMCDKILCKMTVFIYSFYAFHIKTSINLRSITTLFLFHWVVQTVAPEGSSATPLNNWFFIFTSFRF